MPNAAVITEKEKTFCVVVAGGRVVRRPIAVGLRDAAVVEVVSGLNGAEAVVKANATVTRRLLALPASRRGAPRSPQTTVAHRLRMHTGTVHSFSWIGSRSVFRPVAEAEIQNRIVKSNPPISRLLLFPRLNAGTSYE